MLCRDIDGASSDMRAALCDILNVNISLKVSQIGNDGEVAESTEEQSWSVKNNKMLF